MRCHRAITPRANAGFTLVEILMALLIGVVLVASSLHVYFHYRLAYLSQEQVNEMHQNVRTASELIAYDMRMAGYGVPAPYSTLSQWVDWMPGISNIVVASAGTGTPASDRLSIVGVFEPPASRLTAGVSRGATALPVAGADLLNFSLTDRKIVVIGGLETVRITSFGINRLNISRHPTIAGRGLSRAYPAGTPIEVVTVVTYECEPVPTGYPHRPYLLRYTTPTRPNLATSLAAVGIEDLRANPVGGGAWNIELRGRAASPAMQYIDPDFGDGYRRYRLTTRLTPRNRNS